MTLRDVLSSPSSPSHAPPSIFHPPRLPYVLLIPTWVWAQEASRSHRCRVSPSLLCSRSWACCSDGGRYRMSAVGVGTSSTTPPDQPGADLLRLLSIFSPSLGPVGLRARLTEERATAARRLSPSTSIDCFPTRPSSISMTLHPYVLLAPQLSLARLELTLAPLPLRINPPFAATRSDPLLPSLPRPPRLGHPLHRARLAAPPLDTRSLQVHRPAAGRAPLT